MNLRKLWHEIRRPRFIGPFHELTRPSYPVDRSLMARQLDAAKNRPVNRIKPVLLIEDQPDTFVKPVDFDNLPAA